MTKPYLIFSDAHFHNWSQFAKTNEDGMNSRLHLQIMEMKRAVQALKYLGGSTIFNGGDLFHIRGSVQTTVLNPVIDLFKWVEEQGMTVYSIPGNHDLQSKESDAIGNAARSIQGYMAVGIRRVGLGDCQQVMLFPWHSSVDQLKSKLEKFADPNTTAIVHAPVDGIITGIPSRGLNAEYLGSLGYKRVWAGHYHNARDFGNNVYSIGATTHQTWSDVNSSAGFWIVDGDEIKHLESRSPRFIDLDKIVIENQDDLVELCGGNYVRTKVDNLSEAEVQQWRKELTDAGALGVSIIHVKSATSVRTSTAPKTGHSVQDSISNFVKKKKFQDEATVIQLCNDILREAEEITDEN